MKQEFNCIVFTKSPNSIIVTTIEGTHKTIVFLKEHITLTGDTLIGFRDCADAIYRFTLKINGAKKLQTWQKKLIHEDFGESWYQTEEDNEIK